MTLNDIGNFIATNGLAALLVLAGVVFFARVVWVDMVKQRDDAKAGETAANLRTQNVQDQAQAAIIKVQESAQVEIRETRATAQAQIVSATDKFVQSLDKRDLAQVKQTEAFDKMSKTLEGIHRDVNKTRVGPDGQKRRSDDC